MESNFRVCFSVWAFDWWVKRILGLRSLPDTMVQVGSRLSTRLPFEKMLTTFHSLIWGVFQEYHSTHFLKGTPSATLSVIGSLQNAVSGNRMNLLKAASLLRVYVTTQLMMLLAFVTGKLGDR